MASESTTSGAMPPAEPDAGASEASKRERRPRLAAWSAAVCIPLLVVLVYAPGFGTPDHPKQYVNWDDDIFIRDNPDLHSGRGLFDIWDPRRADPIRNYYPITHTSHWLEFRLWWAWPPGTYAIDVLLHAANALLVFALARTFGLSLRVAWLAGLLFALHPMLAASVAWLAERKNLLSTGFALAALIFYVRHCRSGNAGQYRAALICMIAGLLSKTAVVTMPLSMLAADWLIVRRRGLKTIWPLVPMLLVGGGLSWIKSGQETAGGYTFAEPWPLRPLAAANALSQYLIKLVWPLDLRTLYPKWEVAWTLPWILPLAGVLLGALLIVWLRGRLGGIVTWCGVHFAITLLPVSGLAAFGYLFHSPLADHFVYLGAVGVLIAVAILAEWLAGRACGACGLGSSPWTRFCPRCGLEVSSPWNPRSVAVYAAGGAACVALAGLTVQRVQVWNGPVAFWSHTVAGYPDYEFARRRLAQACNEEGRFERAVPLWEQLIAARPDDPNAAQDITNYGSALSELGRTQEAVAQFERAIRLDPDFAGARFVLGHLLYKRGRATEAIAQLAEAARLRPGYWQADGLLAELYARRNDYARACDHARRAVEAYSYNPQLQLLLAHTAVRCARFDEARRACRAALALNPGWPEARALAAEIERLAALAGAGSSAAP